MSESEPARVTVPGARSPWIDGTLAVLVGVGYGLALFNSPTSWLIAVVLLLLAVGGYGFLTFRLARLGAGPPDPVAQRAHGVRVIVLFAVGYLFSRIAVPAEGRLLYAVGGGLLLGLGGFLVLRWQERSRRGVRVRGDR